MKLNIFAARRKDTFETSSAESDVARLELFEVKLKRILVAVAFSEGSRKAVEFAAGLAKHLDAEIVLLHVFEPVPGELKILEATFVDTSFREEANENLQKWQRELSSAGISAQAVFREGTAIDRQIREVAEEVRADLIVVGKHGRPVFLLRNTVNRLVSGAPCPVLVAA